MCVSVPGGLCVLPLLTAIAAIKLCLVCPPIIDLPECSTSLLANWRGGCDLGDHFGSRGEPPVAILAALLL